MLVTPFALVTPQIGRDRCGPLMTVVVPWTILRISPKPARGQRRVRRVVAGPVRYPSFVLWLTGRARSTRGSRRSHRGCWDWPANHDPRHRGKDAGGMGTAGRGGRLQHLGDHWPSCLPEL